ncbi:MAG: hypothetical protein OEY79_04875, partial [Anaplasmataceae bacterium]|nr:hypothetical protein [Anaplasmataceae bacterium]
MSRHGFGKSSQKSSKIRSHIHLKKFVMNPTKPVFTDVHLQAEAHNFATVDGIEDVKLVELQYEWGGEIEIRKSGNLLGTLIYKNGLDSTKKADIIFAKFSIRFEDSKTPRKVGIRKPYA